MTNDPRRHITNNVLRKTLDIICIKDFVSKSVLSRKSEKFVRRSIWLLHSNEFGHQNWLRAKSISSEWFVSSNWWFFVSRFVKAIIRQNQGHSILRGLYWIDLSWLWYNIGKFYVSKMQLTALIYVIGSIVIVINLIFRTKIAPLNGL